MVSNSSNTEKTPLIWRLPTRNGSQTTLYYTYDRKAERRRQLFIIFSIYVTGIAAIFMLYKLHELYMQPNLIVATVISEQQQAVIVNPSKPNAFIRVHITNDEIVQTIADVQKKLITANNSITQFLVPLKSLHITMLTIRVENEDLARAGKALANATDQIARRFWATIATNGTTLPQLQFDHFDSFDRQTLYAALDQQSKTIVEELHALIGDTFHSEGFQELGEHIQEYHPHMTVAMLPDDRRQQELSHLWNPLVAAPKKVIGDEHVRALQLCSIVLDTKLDDYPVWLEAAARPGIRKTSKH